MKKFMKNHKGFVIMTIVLIMVIIVMIVMNVLSNNSDIAEAWTRSFGKGYANVFRTINEAFRLSLTEISVISLIIFVIIYLSWGFCLLGNKKYWEAINRFLLVTLVIVSTVAVYDLSVGMAYKRKALPVDRYTGEIDKAKFKDIASYFVEDMNHCVNELGIDEKGEIKAPYTDEILISNLRKEFAKLNNSYYFSTAPKAKPLLSSHLFTTVSIVGMYFGPLGEANYSTFSTNGEKPFYIAHEMCHGLGVMREDDAQILASEICLRSSDPYIRYSAYYNTIDRIIDLVRLSENKDDINYVNSLHSDDVLKNFHYIYEHWKGQAFLADFGDKVNDWYLKTFGQKEGTTSYIDTDTDVDDKGHVVSLSHYQSIYYRIYFEKN